MISVEDIIGTLSLASNEEYLRGFEEYHAKLFDTLTNDDPGNSSKILEMWQKYCEIARESDLSSERPIHLSAITPRLSSLLSDTIVGIDHSFSMDPQIETFETIAEIIQKIIRVLEPFNLLFQTVAPACKPAIQDDFDFILHLGDIQITIFQHCQKYRTVYSNVPYSMNQYAGSVLKTCNEIHIQYIKCVQSLSLDPDDAIDLNLLINIVKKLFLIGVAVTNLDVKTMALLWKGFLSILESYAVHIRSEFDLSPIIEFFCEEITKKVGTLYENSDASYRSVTLKILCFLMKVIVKLCSYWCGYLEKFVPPLIRLIFFLYGHSISCSKYTAVSLEIIEEIDRSLFAGVDSLIILLINDHSFIRYYTRKNIRKNINAQNEIVPLMLLCTIVQKLVSCVEDIQVLWLQHSIIDVSLYMISEFHRTLGYEIKMASNFLGSSKLPREIFLYDTLLVSISGLIITDFSGTSFKSLEMTLIKHLLQAPLLVKIFISDLWCIIDRYGNAELRLTHINYLRSALEELDCGKIEAVIILSLVRRLFKFLSPKQQIQLLKLADDFKLVHPMLSSMNQCIEEVALTEMKRLRRSSKNYVSFEERISLVRLVAVMKKCDVVDEGEFVSWMKNSFLMEQWNSIVELTTFSRLEDLDQIAEFIFHLCCATSSHIVTMSPPNVVQLLKCVNDFLKCESNLLLLNVQKILKACGPIPCSDSCARQFSAELVSVFSACFRSRNSIVKQHSLESFSYFCHITVYDCIIQETIKSEPKLKDDLALYLQKKLRKVRNKKNIEDFISNLYINETKEIFDETKVSSIERCPFKKIKLHSSVFVKMSEAETILKDLVEMICGEDALDASEKIRLKILLDNADKLRKFV